VQEGPDDIVFLHRIAPGSADKSYGIHVARLAGVPREVLDRAEQMLAELEGGGPRAAGQLVPLDTQRNGSPLRVR
jgi:DNA mismatch repair protein MutS